MEDIMVTGVSTGIGHALAKLMLQRGFRVHGTSRRAPPDLMEAPNFHFRSIDLADSDAVADSLRSWLTEDRKVQRLKYLFLNAGLFGWRIAPMHAVSADEINYIMRVNVWSNKDILDTLLNNAVGIDTCIVSSSIAGVRARAGNGVYAISKAALNMMIRLYALECPRTYFAVLGLCNVDTSLSRTALALPLDGTFPEQEKLRARSMQAGYLDTAEKRAADIDRLLQGGLQARVPSGEFADIRSLI